MIGGNGGVALPVPSLDGITSVPATEVAITVTEVASEKQVRGHYWLG